MHDCVAADQILFTDICILAVQFKHLLEMNDVQIATFVQNVCRLRQSLRGCICNPDAFKCFFYDQEVVGVLYSYLNQVVHCTARQVLATAQWTAPDESLLQPEDCM